MDFKLRPATTADIDFLVLLHRAAFKPYVQQIWGWDDEWQRNYYLEHFKPEIIKIIQVADADIGMLVLVDGEKSINLRLIAITPSAQGQGIGATIICWVQQQAQAQNKSVTLRVFQINPAKNLYERLGFRIYRQDDIYYDMIWRAD